MNSTLALTVLASLGLSAITWRLFNHPKTSQLMASSWWLVFFILHAFVLGICLTFFLLYHQP